jgi:hypothetical protein
MHTESKKRQPVSSQPEIGGNYSPCKYSGASTAHRAEGSGDIMSHPIPQGNVQKDGGW